MKLAFLYVAMLLLGSRINAGAAFRESVTALQTAQARASSRSRLGIARIRLNRILSRPEFGGDEAPGMWERLRERIAAWIQQTIQRILRLGIQHPGSSRILFWLLIAGGVTAAGFCVVRFWSRNDGTPIFSGSSDGLHTQAWEEWLAAARKASENGDPRRAIQCGYWAGVARLQQSGALPRDLTRTPREYLHLLSRPQPGSPGFANFSEPLTSLTSQLERFWYARLTPSAGDFSTCLGLLEALGCKVN